MVGTSARLLNSLCSLWTWQSSLQGQNAFHLQVSPRVMWMNKDNKATSEVQPDIADYHLLPVDPSIGGIFDSMTFPVQYVWSLAEHRAPG